MAGILLFGWRQIKSESDTVKFHQIRALVAINQCGSINEASQMLHVTQPALSRSIKDLERELGLTLLQRSYKGMSLTDEGRRIIRHAHMAVESMRRLQIEADNIRAPILDIVQN